MTLEAFNEQDREALASTEFVMALAMVDERFREASSLNEQGRGIYIMLDEVPGLPEAYGAFHLMDASSASDHPELIEVGVPLVEADVHHPESQLTTTPDGFFILTFMHDELETYRVVNRAMYLKDFAGWTTTPLVPNLFMKLRDYAVVPYDKRPRPL